MEELGEWRRGDLAENRPLPLIVEVLVDTTFMAPGQALVITDTNGKRWNCAETLDANSLGGSTAREILLESWTVHLGDAEGLTSAQLNDQLPNVYKKGVVMFRSLYTYLRLLPTWKLHRRLGRQTGPVNALSLKYRLKRGPWGRSSTRSSREATFRALCQTDLPKVTANHSFESLICPAGPLQINVQYRVNVDFSIADSEELLSSKFAVLDASLQDRSMYGRSLPGQRSQGETTYGSIGASRATDNTKPLKVAGGGAYGSLGTFHAAGKRDSPVTVLRQRAQSQDQDDGDDRPASISRRPSVASDSSWLKNPPFKAGSYVSSSRGPTSPSTSAPRPSAFGVSAPKRLSLNTLPQQALRAPSSGIEHAIASSGSASPKPAPVHRYSSSFANRKRFTSHSSGKTGESTTSSGRGSESSKERSGQLEEGNTASSGSGRTDEDDIAAFISTVEQAKDLASFSSPKRPGTTSINLNRFKGMGVTGGELADEMSNSSLVQNSLTPPSRRLSNVPGLSTSSSPGRVFAHAPHVRSRLSTHSIAEVKESESSTSKAQPVEEQDDGSSDDEPFIFQQDNIL